MALVLIRIDDRLVHGQVLEGWLPAVRANRILALRSDPWPDSLQENLFSLALPPMVRVDSLTVEEAVKQLHQGSFENDRVLLLSPSPREVLRLIQLGVHVESVNVGGLHYAFGRVELGKAIKLDPEDKTALLEIAGLGVKLEGRATPTDEPMDIISLLKD